jgi:hypothetical protein
MILFSNLTTLFQTLRLTVTSLRLPLLRRPSRFRPREMPPTLRRLFKVNSPAAIKIGTRGHVEAQVKCVNGVKYKLEDVALRLRVG